MKFQFAGIIDDRTIDLNLTRISILTDDHN